MQLNADVALILITFALVNLASKRCLTVDPLTVDSIRRGQTVALTIVASKGRTMIPSRILDLPRRNSVLQQFTWIQCNYLNATTISQRCCVTGFCFIIHIMTCKDWSCPILVGSRFDVRFVASLCIHQIKDSE